LSGFENLRGLIDVKMSFAPAKRAEPSVPEVKPKMGIVIPFRPKQKVKRSPIQEKIDNPVVEVESTTVEVELPNQDWLTTTQFAELASIQKRNAQSALKNAFCGKLWRGYKLQVRTKKSQGGRQGLSYLVYAPSLPDELVKAWYKQFMLEVEIPKIPAVEQPKGAIKVMDQHKNQQKQEDLLKKKEALVEQILAVPKETDARRQRIRDLAAVSGFSERTLYRLVKKAQDGKSLKRKMRNDTGFTRVSVTRAWDRHMRPLLVNAQRKLIAERLTKHIRSLWRSGASGYVTVQKLSYSFLKEETRNALAALEIFIDENLLEKLCEVTRSRVEKERQYVMAHIHDTDAKKFHDNFTPNIMRHRNDLVPMQIVCGDVHPLDIGLDRADGSRAYPKAIAWQDLATNRIWFTLKLCEPNENVTQSDIVQSYAGMVQAWGIPTTLYLDNGKEYGGDSIHRAIANLSGVIQQNLDFRPNMPSIIRAMAYEAQAKPIEGFFSRFEQEYLSSLPGYVGGERMRKKTQNMGEEPKPYPGSLEEFHQAIDTMLATYHATPQRGSLKGDSPNFKLQKFIDDGWKAYQIESEQLLLCFAKRGETRTVGRPSAGYVQYEGVFYYSDKLLEFTNMRLPVVIPIHDPRFLFVLPPGEKPVCAVLDRQYSFFDGLGTDEKKRRKKAMLRIIRNQKRHCDLLSLENLFEKWVGEQSDTPKIPVMGQVDVTPEIKELAKTYEYALDQDSTLPKSPQKAKSLYDAVEDPLVEQVEWVDEE
jgi:hypothetical protein